MNTLNVANCQAPVTVYVEDRQSSEFYPTPASLVQRMLNKVQWDIVETVLEPSAGKGDIVRGIATGQFRKQRRDSLSIDCIEIDANLRAILKYNFSEEAKRAISKRKTAIINARSKYEKQDWDTKEYLYYDSQKREYIPFPEDEQQQLAELDVELAGFLDDGIRIVHDDFLSYTAYKQYNLIVMNPPFSNGAKHLIRAIEMQQNGGQIVCLLNAETIRNPYTAERRHLVNLLKQYDADIEYIEDAFQNAERSAEVETALVYLNIPHRNDDAESIFEQIAKKKDYSEPDPEDQMEIEVTDIIQAIVNRYRIEVESGIELIRTYKRMLPYLRSELSTDNSPYSSPIITLTDGSGHDMTVNRYVRAVRLKYWRALLANDKFVGKLTSTLQQKYRERVSSYAEYDFSEFNIYALISEMNAEIKTGIEDEIGKMYDRLTEEHSYYPECQKNRHLYNGWKTNKAWKIEKKCIIPCYGVFSSWSGTPRTYEAYGVLSDIERILNFFDGNMTTEIELSSQINFYFERGITKNIPCKFFEVTFYKKGTCHIKFTCPELIDRFNIYAAQQRGWLPPSYGKKRYADMDAEEREVIDNFQGEAAYEKIMRNPSYYLTAPVGKQNMLTMFPEAV